MYKSIDGHRMKRWSTCLCNDASKSGFGEKGATNYLAEKEVPNDRIPIVKVWVHSVLLYFFWPLDQRFFKVVGLFIPPSI
jgi:hypothetical protein